jgi:flagella basal body P-ring formation protein FlgA
VVAALAVCASASAAVTTQPAGETVVRLYSAAVVTDDDVRLVDVAELDAETAKLAGSWMVAEAPRVGGTRVVDLESVQRALANKDVNLSQWVFRGSSRCMVSRPKNCLPVATSTEDDRTASHSKRASAATSQPAVASVDPNSLQGVLTAYLGQKLTEIGGAPVVKFSPVVSKALALTRPQYEFRVTDRPGQPLGMVSVEVTISEQGKVVQTLSMLVHVSVKKSVVVAARAINRSQRVNRDDVTLAERTFDRIEDVGMSETSPLLGQQAKRTIERGEQLNLKDFEPIPLVQRNDLVTVWVRRGGVSVKGAAKAMKAASYGEQVILKNEGSNKTFTAVVTGPRTAEVSAGLAGVDESAAEDHSR